MKRCILLAIFILVNFMVASAQLGGKYSFEFLNLPVGSRVSALGGVVISATVPDVNMFLSNPSLLDTAVDNHASWSYLPFYADVNYNTFSYARHSKKLGMFGFGMQHLNYGTVSSYDMSGNEIGKFTPGETAITLSHSRQQGPFRLGVNLKYIHSSIDTYSSSALAMDLGGSFIHPEQELVVSLLFKNYGFKLTNYSSASTAGLPSDVQVGVTFKPKFMPFRFTFTLYNLNKLNSTYYDSTFQSQQQGPSNFDRFFRHVNLGAELVLSKNFNLRFGYNYLIKKELKLENTGGGAGFSFGMMVRVKAFEFSYSRVTYHADGGRSQFTVTSNFNRIFKKKSII